MLASLISHQQGLCYECMDVLNRHRYLNNKNNKNNIRIFQTKINMKKMKMKCRFVGLSNGKKKNAPASYGALARSFLCSPSTWVLSRYSGFLPTAQRHA